MKHTAVHAPTSSYSATAVARRGRAPHASTHHAIRIDRAAGDIPSLFEHLPFPCLHTTPDGVVRAANAAAVRLFGQEAVSLAGQSVRDLCEAEDAPRVTGCLEQALRTRKGTLRAWHIRCGSGRHALVDVSCGPLPTVEGPSLLWAMHDERPLAPAALPSLDADIDLLAQALDLAFWIAEPGSGAVLHASPALRALCALPAGEGFRLAQWSARVAPLDRPHYEAFLLALARGETATVNMRICGPGGELRWVACRSSPCMIRGQARAAGLVEDITSRRQAEIGAEALMARQKETLLREAHHRMKNSLQGVIGLLRRCAGQHPALESGLTAAISQVRSIAVIHELQSSRGGAPVPLGEMLGMIARSIDGLFNTGGSLSLLDRSSAPLLLSDADTVPLAIVINELLMNAVKHRSSEQPPIELVMHDHAGGALIRIRNPGFLPESFDFASRRGFGQGLDLVSALLPADHAMLSYAQSAGTVCAELALCPPVFKA
ncbi:PAS domain-containing sensor histidine kinase [Methyloversatilis thermotolerans]|uniref:PAS domain-containing sensor histidine kinase n=1 Tax=Methyloversatilis thermotolerans TaxID=1346290 RepID=UPI000371009F|nr:PAS domain-containing protein [Methyloversatilis thermotolerans]